MKIFLTYLVNRLRDFDTDGWVVTVIVSLVFLYIFSLAIWMSIEATLMYLSPYRDVLITTATTYA
mgnify:CR=1 FL=1